MWKPKPCPVDCPYRCGTCHSNCPTGYYDEYCTKLREYAKLTAENKEKDREKKTHWTKSRIKEQKGRYPRRWN